MRAIALAPAAAEALATQAPRIAEIVTPDGAYLLVGETFVHVTGPRGIRGPLTAVVARYTPPAAGADVAVDISTAELVTAPVWPPAGDPTAAAAASLAVLPPAAAALTAGLELLATGDLQGAAVALAGLGEGLTPAGDDVITGIAAWRAIAREPWTVPDEAAVRMSPLGRAYARRAERGELPDLALPFAGALARGDAAAAARGARTLLRWGASSGAALARGLALTSGRAAPRRRTSY